MWNIREFHPEDIDALDLQEAQSYLSETMDRSLITDNSGDARTIEKDGKVVACSGLLWTSKGAHLWGLLGKDAPLLFMTRMLYRVFEVHRGLRITATTEVDFKPGCKWLEMLGFEVIDTVLSAGADGRDHYVYMRYA